jgi:hypothetical protein
MTINASETAIQSPDIFEVYDFVRGTDHYYYTSDFENRTVASTLHTAEAIERSGISITAENAARVCTITIPNTNALSVFLHQANEQRPLSVSIDRYFTDDLTTAENLFVGYATGISFGAGVCTIEFRSILLEIDRDICKVRMQALCNNQLFDSVCGIDPTPLAVSATVTVSTDGKTLSSSSFGAHADTYFTFGKVLFNGAYRFISSHVGNDITIQYPFPSLVTGNTVTAWPGCSKHPGEACIPKFNNLVNFVGMPYIPLKDTQQTAITNG